MSELHDELRALAEQLVATDDEDVRDSADILCRDYRRDKMAIDGLAAVDAMVRDAPEGAERDDPRVKALQERFRDSLRKLLDWAKATERM